MNDQIFRHCKFKSLIIIFNINLGILPFTHLSEPFLLLHALSISHPSFRIAFKSSEGKPLFFCPSLVSLLSPPTAYPFQLPFKLIFKPARKSALKKRRTKAGRSRTSSKGKSGREPEGRQRLGPVLGWSPYHYQSSVPTP